MNKNFEKFRMLSNQSKKEIINNLDYDFYDYEKEDQEIILDIEIGRLEIWEEIEEEYNYEQDKLTRYGKYVCIICKNEVDKLNHKYPKINYNDYYKCCSEGCLSTYQINEESRFYKFYQYIKNPNTIDEFKKLKYEANKITKRLRRYLSNEKLKSKNDSINYLGCSIKEYKIYLEKYFKFDENMTWKNFGTYWEIDHIKPLCFFKYSEEYLKYPLNYKNTRGIPIKYNRLLGNVLSKNSRNHIEFWKLKEENKEIILNLAKWKIK